MTDQILPAGPFPRPQDWPYWIPDTLLGRVPMPSVPSNDVWDRASPIESPAAMPAVSNGGLLGSLASLNDDRSSNGGLLGNLLPALSGSYLSPVPQAPSWESIPTYPTAGAPQLSPELPSPTSWASYGASTPEPPPPANEATVAEDARRAAAERLARGARGRPAAPDAPPAPEAAAEAGEPGLIERTRLNGVDSFYRGTLMGAGRLALMQHYASTPDEPGIDPQTKRWRDQLRKDYPQVLADLARYNRMRTFENPAELAAAAIGQLGGGLPTPESLVGVGAKGATWLARLLKAGLQQGAVTAATDPAVQALNIRAGVQDEYDPWRIAIASGLGFVTGATAKSAAEVLGRTGPPTIAAQLTGLELGEPSAQEHLRTLAMRYARSNLAGRVVTNRDTGLSIGINWQGLKKATSGNRQDTLLKLVPAIPDMLEKGRYLGAEKDFGGRRGIKAYHVFESGAALAGTPHRTFLFVRETHDGRLFYDFGIPSEDE
jgi:Large polyvalent protein-associated domain 3